MTMADREEGAESYRNIAPDAFVKCLNEGMPDGVVIDVRETHEWLYYHLDESIHMPMQSIPGRMSELPADRDIYIVCAHGVRSAMVCDYLARSGLERLINVEGGMAAVSYVKDSFAYD